MSFRTQRKTGYSCVSRAQIQGNSLIGSVDLHESVEMHGLHITVVHGLPNDPILETIRSFQLLSGLAMPLFISKSLKWPR